MLLILFTHDVITLRHGMACGRQHVMDDPSHAPTGTTITRSVLCLYLVFIRVCVVKYPSNRVHLRPLRADNLQFRLFHFRHIQHEQCFVGTDTSWGTPPKEGGLFDAIFQGFLMWTPKFLPCLPTSPTTQPCTIAVFMPNSSRNASMIWGSPVQT